MAIKYFGGALAASLAVAAVGCQEATTRQDVADAQQKVLKEEQDVADAAADGRKEVAEEERDVHETMKPVLDPESREKVAEEKQDVAEAKAEATGAVREEQADVADARRDLQNTQKDFTATQARDAFATDVDRQLNEADEKIAVLEHRADAATGAEKEAVQSQIDNVKAQRERVKEALDSLKSADLDQWKDHQASVQTALRDLDTMKAEIN